MIKIFEMDTITHKKELKEVVSGIDKNRIAHNKCIELAKQFCINEKNLYIEEKYYSKFILKIYKTDTDFIIVSKEYI